MNVLRLSLSFAFLLSLAPQLSGQGVDTVPCGTARINYSNRGAGVVRILFEANLNLVFLPPLLSVEASGVWFNTLNNRRGSFSTPGLRPQLRRFARRYSDFWDIRTGAGIVTISFPVIRATGLTGRCRGLVPIRVIPVGEPSTTASAEGELVAEGADLALVVDTTGSMADDIASVKASASNIVDQLAARNPFFRVAVVQYNDPSASVVQGLTNNRGAITSAINSLGASGGGDFPEFVYSGVRLAINLPWSSFSSRTIIVIGDAPPKDPEPGTGLTQAAITALSNTLSVSLDVSGVARIGTPARLGTVAVSHEKDSESEQVGPVALRQGDPEIEIIEVSFPGLNPLFMIPIGTNAQTTASFTALAEETGGKTIPSLDASGVVDAIITAIDEGTDPIPSPEAETPVIKKLKLKSICWRTRKKHIMQVKNKNDFPVDFTWEVKGRRGSSGSDTVAAGKTEEFVIKGRFPREKVTIMYKDEMGEMLKRSRRTGRKRCFKRRK